MRITTCPDEVELMPLVEGEEADAEVTSHLEWCEACRKRLSQLKSELQMLREIAKESTLAMQAGKKSEPLPENIGRYEVLERLDSGGQATVYRAMHPSLKQEVVIKMGREPVPPEEAEGDWLVNEARLLVDLDHPNLARVYDLDFHEHHPYVVMEYIRGRTLAQVARERAFSCEEAAHLIAKVCGAVATAHRVGVFHRDITPRNILLDENNEPHLIDFGLARIRHAWGEKAEPLGLVAGTSTYMSPEQALGRTDEIDARSDVYGLGQVLRFLLSDRSDPLVSVPPLRSDVSPRLEQVIERATAEKREDRFGSVDELARALHGALRRSRRWIGWTIFGCLFAVAAVLAIVLWPTESITVNREEILAYKDGRPIGYALPVSASPKLMLSGHVPRGWWPVVVFVDPGGAVELHTDLSRAESSSQQLDHYQYWLNPPLRIGRERGGRFVADDASTKLVMLLAFPKAKADAEIAKLKSDLQAMLADWNPPADKIDSAMVLFGEKVELAQNDRGSAPSQLSDNEKRLEALMRGVSQKLRDAGVVYAKGIAFPYDPADPHR